MTEAQEYIQREDTPLNIEAMMVGFAAEQVAKERRMLVGHRRLAPQFNAGVDFTLDQIEKSLPSDKEIINKYDKSRVAVRFECNKTRKVIKRLKKDE